MFNNLICMTRYIERSLVSGLCLCLVPHLCLTLWDPMDCSLLGSCVHGDSAGKNTGVGSHALLQGIFPTQGLNSGLPNFRQIIYHLSHQGRPWILEWYIGKDLPEDPLEKGQATLPLDSRNRTGVSCIAGGCFTNWAIREAQRETWKSD